LRRYSRKFGQHSVCKNCLSSPVQPACQSCEGFHSGLTCIEKARYSNFTYYNVYIVLFLNSFCFPPTIPKGCHDREWAVLFTPRHGRASHSPLNSIVLVDLFEPNLTFVDHPKFIYTDIVLCLHEYDIHQYFLLEFLFLKTSIYMLVITKGMGEINTFSFSLLADAKIVQLTCVRNSIIVIIKIINI
jgi:hypothetical protein